VSVHSALGAVAIVFAFAVPALAQSPEPQTNLSDIEDEVICLVCGTTLELTDDAPQAQQLRDQIRGLIDQGLTKDEIKGELVDEYGESVLATPGTEGFDLTAWVLPGLAIALAAIAIAFALQRNRARAPGPAPSRPSAEDNARLDRDLSSFDS